MFPYHVGLPLHVKYVLCLARTSHLSNACVSLSWCLNQRLKLFPKKHMRKTLASILSEKATAAIKRVKDCEHTSECVKQRKRRTGNLSRFYGTPLVILSR